MLGSSILDTAIGIVFVFLLLSLIASTINELLLSLVNMRARDLVRGLKELLNSSDGKGLVESLFNHGLIFGLFEGKYEPGKSSNLPSYIPARSFALALMDLIPRYAQDTKSTPAADALSGAQGATSPSTPASDNLVEPFRKAVAQLTDSKIREPLLAMIDAANKDANALRQNIENWYNSTMDRVSGWYKYRTQWIIFFIGIILSVTVNVDTFVVARHLSNDAALRQSLVAAAEQASKQPTGQDQRLQDQAERIQSLGLPIGWLKFSDSESSVEVQQRKQARDEYRIFAEAPLGSIVWYHLWGWLLTALAVSLGAPFWFDVLNKIIVVRSTIKPREKSPEEKSKD